MVYVHIFYIIYHNRRYRFRIALTGPSNFLRVCIIAIA